MNLKSAEAKEQSSHTYSAVQIAPFNVARVGGMPVQKLDGLFLEETARYIQIAFEREADLEKLVADVEALLFAQVPLVGDDKELRRRILAAKRHVHNGRVWADAAQDVECICAVLGPQAALLLQWYALARQKEAALQCSRQAYERELEQAMRTLEQGMQHEDLQQGLALASPDLLQELARDEKQGEWRPTSKLARSSLSYLARMTLKTSPLSTFTHLSVVDMAGGSAQAQDAAQEGRPHRVMQLVRTLPAGWLTLIAAHPELSMALCYEPNKGLNVSEEKPDTIQILTSQYTLYGDFAWRGESTIERKFDRLRAPELSTYLEKGGPRSYDEVLTLLPGDGKRARHRVFTQLLNMQLLKPVAPYSRRDPSPLLALAAALEGIQGELAAAIAVRLRKVQGCVDTSLYASGYERLRLIEEMRQCAIEVFKQLGVTPPAWVHTTNLLYEDVHYSGPALHLDQRIQEDLRQVADVLRPSIVRTQLYDYLYRSFVERFGSAGEAQDVLGFLEQFLAREDASELIGRASAEDQMTLQHPGHQRSTVSSGQSAIPPAVTIFYQLAASSQEALARGEYQLVVNQVCSGQGGLFGRFSRLLDAEHGNLLGQLSAWTQQLYGGRPVVELPVAGDWNNLQAEVGLSKQTLHWPGELPTTEQPGATLELRDLRLRADPETETLYITDATGRVLAPTYLGVVPTHLISTAVRLFVILIDPWMSNYPVSWQVSHLSAPKRPVAVEFYPRQETGHIVLRRARWRFPVEQVPVRQKGEADFEFFVRMQRWRIEHHLPEEVYASTERAQLSFEAKARKPVWIHFHSPHSLELLRQLLDKEVLALCLTEALPAHHQHWVQPVPEDPAERSVSEFMALACWPASPRAPQAVPHTTAVPATLPHRLDDWLYFKIYPACSDQMDEILRQIVAPAVKQARTRSALERWFFIRYMDQRGWHIRFRLQGTTQALQEIQEMVADLIDQTLPILAHEPPHFLLPPALSPRIENGQPGYTLDLYEPEYEKYGGREGVLIAERLFEASSDIALQIVKMAGHGNANRVLLTLYLMKQLVDSIYVTYEERIGFWERHMWYWSGQDRPEGAQLRTSFTRAAQARCALLSRQLSHLAKNAQMHVLIDHYQAAIDVTLEALANAGARVSVPGTSLSFDYIHMHNNRLGIVPLEESYLAALLLEVTHSVQEMIATQKEVS